ncbi:hypothetical protein CH341_31310, partial [Rhodoplanes roseus]
MSVWTTGTAYVVGPPASVVTQGGATYVCLVAHTAGTFATDLSAGKWRQVSAKGDTGAQGSTGAAGPAAWTAVSVWTTATAYGVGPPASVVTQGGATYVCLVAHTAGTFATDL